MKKFIIIAVIIIVALVGVVTVFGNGDDKSTTMDPNMNMDSNSMASSDEAPANEIYIEDFDFSKPMMSVKKGTTVTWTNKDDARHDVTPNEETADFKASELLAQGETYSVTFNSVGTFKYNCSPHPYMTAEIQVTE